MKNVKLKIQGFLQTEECKNNLNKAKWRIKDIMDGKMIGRREKSRKQRSNDHASHCGTGTMFSLAGGEAKKGGGMKKVLIFLHYASGFFF